MLRDEDMVGKGWKEGSGKEGGGGGGGKGTRKRKNPWLGLFISRVSYVIKNVIKADYNLPPTGECILKYLYIVGGWKNLRRREEKKWQRKY